MTGASTESPLICSTRRTGGYPRSLVLNWYAVDRLRPVDIDHGIEVLSSILNGPVGFTTSWNRFVGGSSYPYETQLIVEPDKSITIGGRNYDVRVIKAKNSRFEDNEYWFDKKAL